MADDKSKPNSGADESSWFDDPSGKPFNFSNEPPPGEEETIHINPEQPGDPLPDPTGRTDESEWGHTVDEETLDPPPQPTASGAVPKERETIDLEIDPNPPFVDEGQPSRTGTTSGIPSDPTSPEPRGDEPPFVFNSTSSDEEKVEPDQDLFNPTANDSTGTVVEPPADDEPEPAKKKLLTRRRFVIGGGIVAALAASGYGLSQLFGDKKEEQQQPQKPTPTKPRENTRGGSRTPESGTHDEGQPQTRDRRPPQEEEEEEGAPQRQVRLPRGKNKFFIIGTAERDRYVVTGLERLFKQLKANGLEPLIAIQTSALSQLAPADREQAKRDPRTMARKVSPIDIAIGKAADKVDLNVSFIYPNHDARPGDMAGIQRENKNLAYQLEHIDPKRIRGIKGKRVPCRDNRLIIVITDAQNEGVGTNLVNSGHVVAQPPIHLKEGTVLGSRDAKAIAEIIEQAFKSVVPDGESEPTRAPVRRQRQNVV